MFSDNLCFGLIFERRAGLGAKWKCEVILRMAAARARVWGGARELGERDWERRMPGRRYLGGLTTEMKAGMGP